MKRIVDRLERYSIEVIDYPEPVQERVLRAREIWHYYWAIWDEEIDLRDIRNVFDSFFRPELQGKYFRGTITRVMVGASGSDGKYSPNWRTLTGVIRFSGAFGQLQQHQEKWLRASDYTAVFGAAVEVRAPEWYEEKML
jgi:hypothetical protein